MEAHTNGAGAEIVRLGFVLLMQQTFEVAPGKSITQHAIPQMAMYLDEHPRIAAFQYIAPVTQYLANGCDFVPTLHNDTYDFIKPDQFELNDRAVLIAGASKGIGRETALSFARAGASKIGIGARSSLDSLKAEIETVAEEAGRRKPQVLALQLDFADNASAEAGAATVEKTFECLDILINNAGYLEPSVKIIELEPEEWTRSWQVNVFGTYYVTRAFLPLLLKSPQGLKQIVNLSSVGANLVVPH